MSDAENASKPTEDTSKDLIEDGCNKLNVKCKFCGSKILDKKSAQLITQEFELPNMLQDTRKEDVQNEKLNKFYQVENILTFENIGLTNTVDDYKYLSCADCDAGPIGYLDMNTDLSYVALSRIEHA